MKKLSTTYEITKEVGGKQYKIYCTINEETGTLNITDDHENQEFVFKLSKPETVKVIAEMLLEAADLRELDYTSKCNI